MANSTIDLWVDVLVLSLRGRKSLLRLPGLALPRFHVPIELGHELFWPKMRVGIAMTADAPGHRQLLSLVDRFHLIDAPMTRLAADARIDVHGMVEVDELGQVVDALPGDPATGFPALVNRCQLRALGVNRSHRGNPLIVCRAVAVHTGRRRRHCRMGRVKDRVVTVATIHLQLAGVNRVAERDRLLGLVADIECLRIGNQSTHRSGEYGAGSQCDPEQSKERIDPSRKQKPLHNEFWPTVELWAVLAQKGKKIVATLLTDAQYGGRTCELAMALQNRATLCRRIRFDSHPHATFCRSMTRRKTRCQH